MCFNNICTDKLLKTYLSKSITFGKNLKTETWYFTARVWCLWLLLQFLLTLSNIFIYKTLGVVKWSLWKDKQPLKFWLFKDLLFKDLFNFDLRFISSFFYENVISRLFSSAINGLFCFLSATQRNPSSWAGRNSNKTKFISGKGRGLLSKPVKIATTC